MSAPLRSSVKDGCEGWSISKRTLLDLQVNSPLITRASRLAEINTDLTLKRTLKFIQLRETCVSQRWTATCRILRKFCSHSLMLRKDMGSAQTGIHYWAGNCLFSVVLAKWNEDMHFFGTSLRDPNLFHCLITSLCPQGQSKHRGRWHMADRTLQGVLFLWLPQSIVLKHWAMLLCVTVMYTCIKVLKKSSLIIFLWCLSAVRSAWKSRQHRGSPSPAAHL